MTKKTLLLFLLFVSYQLFSQEFEGRIVYKNSCSKPKNSVNSFDLKKFLAFMGDTTVFTTKKGSFKEISNGRFKPFQLYNTAEPTKLYYKENVQSDTLFYIDYNRYSNFRNSYKIEKNADTILGYVCHKLIVKSKTKNSETHYYFAPKLKQNPEHYKEFKHDDLNNLMRLTESIILKYDNFGGGMVITREAVKVESVRIPKRKLKIPKAQVLIDKSK